MRPTWLIEAGVYGNEAIPLLHEIRRQGLAGDFVPYQSVRTGSSPIIAGQRLQPGDCVIGYGTFPFAQQILLHQPWTPGAWCSAQNLDCVTYYRHFQPYLLNREVAILPGIQAIRDQDRLFARFANDGKVFARPTSSHKLFVGRCIDRETFARALAPTRYDPESLVVIASPRPIVREWRLVVVQDRVIAGSQYAIAGQRAIAAECPREVIAFAERMLAEVRWRPDAVFMLDICQSSEQLWLVELNSFSGSWLYQCDLNVVVAEVSELAQVIA